MSILRSYSLVIQIFSFIIQKEQRADVINVCVHEHSHIPAVGKACPYSVHLFSGVLECVKVVPYRKGT